MTGSTDHLRQFNLETVRQALRRCGPSTKAEIAAASGLSYPTCNTALNELAAAGEVFAEDPPHQGSGRPAPLYRYNSDYALLLCVALTNENRQPMLDCAVFDLLYKEKGRWQQPFKGGGPAELTQVVLDAAERYPAVKAIALSIPGVVCRQAEIASCDVPSLEKCPLKQLLETSTGKQVRLENDMNAAVLGFHQMAAAEQSSGRYAGAGAEMTSAALLTFPRGNNPGAGLISNGKLLHGARYFAGEISYLPPGPLLWGNQKMTDAQLRQAVADAVIALAALLDPSTVLLTGGRLQGSCLPNIKRLCAAALPAGQVPEIVFEEDINRYLQRGLCLLAFESLSYPLEIVSKQL